ncbi:MAG: DUF4962 domain-containing protein, partial [Candidatus Latescibacterota bacterium]
MYSFFRTATPFLALFLLCSISSFAQTVSWDFESGPEGWRAVSKAITVAAAKSSDRVKTGQASLSFLGNLQGGDRLAESDIRPMKEAGHYRLSVWVRIDKPSFGAFAPRLICEFLAPEGSLGREPVEDYNSGSPGSWQRLLAEFRAPIGTEQCRLALVSSGKASVETGAVELYLDDITLESIPRLTVEGKYALDPIPPALAAARGVHPRIYLNKARLARLREAIKTTHAPMWEEVRAQADKLIGGKPVEYRPGSAERPHDEQLWQRPIGESFALLATAYVLTGDRKYLDSARERALAACAYPTWGAGVFEGTDLSTGHLLYGMAILYDWCYDDLGADARKVIRETIVQRGGRLFELGVSGTIATDLAVYREHPWPEWDTAYLQNHQWINTCALAASAVAVFDEAPEVLPRIAFAIDRYRRALSFLPDDGSFHEGAPYWGYGLEYMLKFLEFSRDLLAVNFYSSPWLQKTAEYRLYQSLPRNSWTSNNLLVDIGDSPRYDWYGPEYMLRRLAGEFRDTHAQWLAGEIDRANYEKPIARWLNLLWFDPALKETSPAGLPTLHRFPDTGIVTARSDWSGDESFLMFKCGPYIGRHAIHAMTYCPSSAHHVHPDAGNFVLFGEGEWLLREDGYLGKYTGQHNTLLVNGKGQMGEGGPIFDGVRPHALKADPKVLKAVSTPALDQITGDAAPAYPPEMGLRKFTRHLLFLKPDILIVADDIALDKADELELRFHPEQQKGESAGNTFIFRGKKADLRLELLTPDGVKMTE